MTPKSKIEIIDETVAFYSANPNGLRAKNFATGTCRYKLVRHGVELNCAVGRCQISPKSLLCYVENLELAMGTSFQESLKPEYRGHNIEFWTQLQQLHDNDRNWNDTGLSENGKDTVKNMKSDFA